MIKELYIDNFRCFSNFKINPEQFQLWMGDNGAGKSSATEALRLIQDILAGQNIVDLVNEKTLTKWDKRNIQTFGITIEIDHEIYEYEILLEHDKNTGKCRINKEQLKWEKQIFFIFDGNDAHLYRINNTTHQVEEGTSFPADWYRSVIPGIAPRNDNKPLICFREEARKWLILRSIPVLVSQLAESEDKQLSKNAENFAAWYRHLLQEYPGITYKTRESLKDVFQGFEELSLNESGDTRKLRAKFRINNTDHIFDFNELSDGQRQLIVLYAIIESLKQKVFSVLVIDEPDNFVSLREIQPWLKLLEDTCEEEYAQAIVISHHPEIINDMAHGSELWFSRHNGAQVVAKQYPATKGLLPAESVARGWEK